MSEEKKITVNRRVAPGNPVKAANKFLYARLNDSIQLDVCNLDLADLHIANQKLLKGEEARVDLTVVDRFLLPALAIAELHEMTRIILEDLKKAGILELQPAIDPPKSDGGGE